jgi:hypothetical protein
MCLIFWVALVGDSLKCLLEVLLYNLSRETVLQIKLLPLWLYTKNAYQRATSSLFPCRWFLPVGAFFWPSDFASTPAASPAPLPEQFAPQVPSTFLHKLAVKCSMYTWKLKPWTMAAAHGAMPSYGQSDWQVGMASNSKDGTYARASWSWGDGSLAWAVRQHTTHASRHAVPGSSASLFSCIFFKWSCSTFRCYLIISVQLWSN